MTLDTTLTAAVEERCLKTIAFSTLKLEKVIVFLLDARNDEKKRQ